MNKVRIITALFAVMPLCSMAQVDKTVEVTKAYVPKVEYAEKLAVKPDMTDTTRLRPEIDYTVTPLSLQTAFDVRPIRPATVTYWEFNRPLPFYLKVGAGYPLNSVVDFYASTHHPDTGYLLGYINHNGEYDRRKNLFDGLRHRSTQMTNRGGVAAGKYLGRRLLEGELSYENRYHTRYGAFYAPQDAVEGETTLPEASVPGSMADFSDARFKIRFGDDFQDLNRTNFEVAAHFDYFLDHSDWPDYGDKARQFTTGIRGRVARAFRRNYVALEVAYDLGKGQQAIADYKEHFLKMGLRYARKGSVVNLEGGADFIYDNIVGRGSEWHILPCLKMNFNLGTYSLVPFLEIDGELHRNDYASLSRLNPYLMPMMSTDKSSPDYNGRAGIRGTLGRDVLNYRINIAASLRDHHPYWFGRAVYDPAGGRYSSALLAMDAEWKRQVVYSLEGQIEWRPVTSFRMSLGAEGYLYDDRSVYGSGDPKFKGHLGFYYEGHKIGFGVVAELQTERQWSLLTKDRFSTEEAREAIFAAPCAVDLRLTFDWKISPTVGVFAEGFNLANSSLYRYPWYRMAGAGFTAGVKMSF